MATTNPSRHTGENDSAVRRRNRFLNRRGSTRVSATMRLQKFLEVERSDPDQPTGQADDGELPRINPRPDSP
jgi:hypothetical protein